ncbi:SH3 domain-containing protein [Adhaeribacter rhizoryzae]|uniref:SH3 domain-containing protein n=1 Tax=Adhaeribacter rhizoryzae TaxID=2607907 RepID=A0A5M6DIF1_9BACT|nr:SH3 domain-containing protein [Adhaeribacter rhizoryzae]KAA5545065.1 SH3 domain-containing protein [Adhaeribacter rhizoryzae]
MKKLIFTFALIIQAGFLFAANDKTIVAQARQDNVKMYQQPGTCTTILRSLSTNDKIEVVRRYNDQWTIVMVDGQPGYVLHSEIGKPAQTLEIKTLASTKTSRK